MYSNTVDKISPIISLLHECRSTAESVEQMLGRDGFEDLDDSCADDLAAPGISEGAAACRQALAALRDEMEAATGSKAISYEAQQGISPSFEHCSLADIAKDIDDSLHELIGDLMLAEQHLLDALTICEEFEKHVEMLKSERYDRALRELAEDPKISLAELVEVVEKTLGCPLHERGIEAFDTLASRVEEAAEEGDWDLWPIMEALSKHPHDLYYSVDRDPIAPIVTKADLIAALLPKPRVGTSVEAAPERADI